MKAGSVPDAVELMKNSGQGGVAAVTEHGARMSRTSKDHTDESRTKASNRKVRGQRQANTIKAAKTGRAYL